MKALDSGLSLPEACEMEARMAELERIWRALERAARQTFRLTRRRLQDRPSDREQWQETIAELKAAGAD
jgi:hypothetical protein